MKKPNYGIDAPNIVRNLILAALLLPLANVMLFSWLNTHYPQHIFLLFSHWGLNLFISTSYLSIAGLMIWSSKVGKLKQRDRLLDLIEWQGNEQVLDVGCGRGLLLIGAAKKLTTGKAIGIDIWQKKDLSNNNELETQKNINLEGVSNVVDIQNADAQELPFADHSFDVILSSLVIHNMNGKEGREKALSEMVRVLKPSGIMLIQDIKHTEEYEEFLEENKRLEVFRSGFEWSIFPPAHVVMAIKQDENQLNQQETETDNPID